MPKQPYRISDETKRKLLSAIDDGQRPATPRQNKASERGQVRYASPGKIEDTQVNRQLLLQFQISDHIGINIPFFQCHQGKAKDTTSIDGKEYLNYSTYDYLDLNGGPYVNNAAIKAIEKYGTSATASRLVSGERPPHRQLELALADFLGTEDCVVMVSGHATNVTVLSHLFTSKDLIIHDSQSHNSLILGAQSSRATRFSYPHSDLDALESYLADNRHKFERAIIVTEGLFSMDGDIPDLPRLLEIKNRHSCFIMIDEAHSIGVVGKTGRGIQEHFNIAPGQVDIQMGTLSKTFCGCGGFIAGSAGLIQMLKYTAPGFVYSVGMAPGLAAASHAALEMLRKEPERVAKLQDLGHYFVTSAQARGLDTGLASGHAIIPIIIGDSVSAGYQAEFLFQRGVNVQPIIYPVVEEGAARLRFFISMSHKKAQIDRTLDLVQETLPLAKAKAEDMMKRNSAE